MANETYPKGEGWVKFSTLKKALSDNNVHMSKPEFDMLCSLYQSSHVANVLNYKFMSQDLGLQSNKLDKMQANPLLMKTIYSNKEPSKFDGASSVKHSTGTKRMRQTINSFTLR